MVHIELIVRILQAFVRYYNLLFFPFLMHFMRYFHLCFSERDFLNHVLA